MLLFIAGFLAFPLTSFALWALIKRYRVLQEWYLGLRITKWWAIWLLKISLKNLSVQEVRTMRAQGYLWFSPKHTDWEDKETVR
jgi:hypothetical protein